MKKTFLLLAAAALIVSLSACFGLDVVGKDSVRAFGEVLEVLPANEFEGPRWALASPDNSAWLFWDNMSVELIVDAKPFTAAGADIAKIEAAARHFINPDAMSLCFSSPGFDMLNENIKDTALEQFERDIIALRGYVGFHAPMDHYNISFGGGNMFEWAKDMATNGYDDGNQDKDIVFVLNPEPLIAAGVDPAKVEGWAYAQVPIEENGKTTQVWKFLKAFNLK